MAHLYLDHNVHLDLADLLTGMGHPTTTARNERMELATDDAHLLLTTRSHRILVSHNNKDFLLLHNAWGRWSQALCVPQAHAGILIVPENIGVPAMGQAVVELLASTAPDDVDDQFHRFSAGAWRTWSRR